MTTDKMPESGISYDPGVRYGRAIELKTRDEGWRVEGFVSTYDRDLGGDGWAPGACCPTLRDGHRLRFLYSHDPQQVLGTPLSLEEDGRKGLFGTFRISKTPLGETVRTLLLDGALGSFSIGYRVVDSDQDAKAGVRRLKDVDLLEVSVVAMPMNTAALVTAAKQGMLGTYCRRPITSLVAPVAERYLGRERPYRCDTHS